MKQLKFSHREAKIAPLRVEKKSREIVGIVGSGFIHNVRKIDRTRSSLSLNTC